MQFLLKSYITLALGLFIFTSCNKKLPDEIKDCPDLITTLKYTLTPSDGGDAIEFKYIDFDGNGGTEPTLVTSDLTINKIYTGSISILNEAESPSENFTEELKEEDIDHQFFFMTADVDLRVDYNDLDADGNPIGLATTLTPGAAGSGTLTITLRHEPDKSADGVALGDITNAKGETDIEVTFPIIIQ